MVWKLDNKATFRDPICHKFSATVTQNASSFHLTLEPKRRSQKSFSIRTILVKYVVYTTVYFCRSKLKICFHRCISELTECFQAIARATRRKSS